MTEDKSLSFPQNLTLEDRKLLTVSGVSDIGSFDEQTVAAMTELGELTIKGENLHINRMSTEMGELVVEGEISSLAYTDIQPKSGFFSRLLK
ncbi:MAG: YabP/YqfC family sporulation protein [Clostridiales bacterium]|nr:YabP/YqfC family sporulation protein [Clostridiales bacterium]MCD7827635.1 YabP/YqfC family sporulation protein [Clostridiales bacterium]